MTPDTEYSRPGLFTRKILNPSFAGLTRLGISVVGSRVLETKGRRSGLPRHTPVNVLHLDGKEYLVAARGETEWVRNVRADGGRLVLAVGRRRHAYVGRELPVAERPEIIRPYLKKWKFEVGAFFHGVGPNSTEVELAAEAARHPVFVLTPS